MRISRVSLKECAKFDFNRSSLFRVIHFKFYVFSLKRFMEQFRVVEKKQ